VEIVGLQVQREAVGQEARQTSAIFLRSSLPIPISMAGEVSLPAVAGWSLLDLADLCLATGHLLWVGIAATIGIAYRDLKWFFSCSAIDETYGAV
jgi:hypothetical protein